MQRSSGLTREVPTLDFGVGLAFEVDTAELQPQASAAPRGRPPAHRPASFFSSYIGSLGGSALAGWRPWTNLLHACNLP